MATPAQLTHQFRLKTAQIAAEVSRAIFAISRTARQTDIDAWWLANEAAILRKIEQGWTVAELAARAYLIYHANASGHDIEPVRPVFDSPSALASARIMGPVAYKKHMALTHNPVASNLVMGKVLAAATSRQALKGARDLLMGTRDANPSIRWRRVTSASACDWCKDMADLGVVSEGKFSCHDGCNCSPEFVYA